MRKTESRERVVFVVKIGHVCVGNVCAIYAYVDQHNSGAGEQLRGFDDVLRCALDHGDKIRQRNRRNERIVGGRKTVRENQLPGTRVDGNKLMIEFEISHG